MHGNVRRRFSGRSCAKTVLVNIFPGKQVHKSVWVYAMLDDQSNCTLATKELLDSLEVEGNEIHYELASCSGIHQSSGRKVHSLNVQSLDGSYQLQLPTVIECDNIPQNRSEKPTPEIARHFSHLEKIADSIPELDPQANISLLIGRDVIEAHQVQEQITGPRGFPFAQRLGLGWVIVGDVCLGKLHKPNSSDVRVATFKTYMVDAESQRSSIFQPCTSNLALKECSYDVTVTQSQDDSLFQRTREDEKVGLSQEDHTFLQIMDKEVSKDDKGHWVAPLPFRQPKQRLPNNRQMALKRAEILDNGLKRNPEKRKHFVTFMAKVIESGAAEVAPPLETGREVWYLPIFGVYNPRKPGKIRGVFDSSATFRGVSLNGTLLSGPNLTNSLIGILLRFRQDQYAIAADIEQMFYAFKVKEHHRDNLRFFWFKENDPNLELIEFRMTAHVFGNSPSPAVATYCLRRSVEKSEQYGEDVKAFVEKDFYVDDGLKSVPTAAEGVRLLQKTQKALQTEGKIRLHKIVSNSAEIMKSFPEEDLGKEIESLSLDKDTSIETHQSLGVSWDLNSDNFRFHIQLPDNPDTRRGLLSTLNSVYDPLGFVAPIVIQGKILMRDVAKGADWDDELDPRLVKQWTTWKEALQSLETLTVPRMFVGQSLTIAQEPELHIFSDASEKAVSCVAFLKVSKGDNVETGFVMGKSKVAPSHGNTIPRLELCAALLATQLGEIIIESLDVPLKTVKYYTDSKVVLGYLNNKTRRFHIYVSNRVQRILSVTKSEQWNYIPTQENPADCGSRGLCSTELLKQNWLTAPKRLLKKEDGGDKVSCDFPLVTPDEDKEIRVEVFKTSIEQNLADRFSRFSDWKCLLRAFSLLKAAVKKRSCDADAVPSKVDLKKESEKIIIQQEQQKAFPEEVQNLLDGEQVHRGSSIASLRPYMDKDRIMRVGGRLNQSCLPLEETNPVILPGKSHVAKLIATHFHELSRHQGRLLTESAIRNKGYWITGAKRLVSSLIHGCVKCRKLRGTFAHQTMADLPEDRLTPGPPFTYVGVDAFGPWSVVTRKTRGGSATSKRWAILFTCLATRAVHIEVCEEMSSSSFINALRRFIALRGNVKQFRSDRGTNFVGATDSLQIDAVNVEDGPIEGFLYNFGVKWLFNPPHSSHMGGVWERMIGLTRRILEGILQDNIGKNLTHEVLVTFMAEACAIINSRPVAPISTDPDDPVILSPAVLLNQKVRSSPIVCQDVDLKDAYRSHWKQVQVLSDAFWKRWREGYLQSLQKRPKWYDDPKDIKNGDVILLKDKEVPRNEWCTGIVTNAIKSASDGKVRKAEIRVSRKHGKCVTYTRPVTEMVVLVSN